MTRIFVPKDAAALAVGADKVTSRIPGSASSQNSWPLYLIVSDKLTRP